MSGLYIVFDVQLDFFCKLKKFISVTHINLIQHILVIHFSY